MFAQLNSICSSTTDDQLQVYLISVLYLNTAVLDVAVSAAQLVYSYGVPSIALSNAHTAVLEHRKATAKAVYGTLTVMTLEGPALVVKTNGNLKASALLV
jgi:hypothetical protein